MKKIIALFVTIFLLTNTFTTSYADKKLDVSAEAAILIDANTGKILYEKNAHKPMFPASTTKIMTAILALEYGNLDDIVVIDDKTPYEISGSHIALEPGEMITLKDLLYALLIESANDAALAIAKHISGSTQNFADLMNKKAKEIGAKNTHFTNPHGLPDKNHTTTAYDLAMMAKYAMENDTFRSIVKNYKYTIPPTNKKDEPRYLKSANRLLYGTGSGNKIVVDGKTVNIKYDGADGIKTGYTYVAQQCLVATAKRGDLRLISVVLHAVGTNVYVDTHKLLNYGFDNYTTKQLSFKNEFIKNIDVIKGDKPFVTGIINKSVFSIIPRGRENDIVKDIILPDKITAPITKDQVIGRVEYKLDGEVIAAANIVSAMEINQKGIIRVVETTDGKSLFKKWWFWFIVMFIIWRIFIGYKRYKRAKRRRLRREITFSYSNRYKY